MNVNRLDKATPEEQPFLEALKTARTQADFTAALKLLPPAPPRSPDDPDPWMAVDGLPPGSTGLKTT